MMSFIHILLNRKPKIERPNMNPSPAINVTASRAEEPTRKVQRYTITVAAIGLVVALFAVLHLPQDRTGLILFMFIAVAVEFTSIELFQNSRSQVSMSSVIAVAAIVALGPFAGVLTYLASGITTAVTTSLRDPQKRKLDSTLLRRTAFNCGMWSIAAAAAGLMYVIAGGTWGTVTPITVIPGLILATIVEWLVNAAILVGVISKQTLQKPAVIWKRDLGWQAPVSIASGVVGGGFLALTYGMYGIVGPAIVLLPIMATGYAFRLYKNNMKEYVDSLEQVNRELVDAMMALETANLDLTDANSAIRRLNAELFQSLARVFDMRDPYVGGHAAQVAVYAVEIATQMGLAPERIEHVRQSAYLHDIGKLAIPEAILHKTGAVTEIEYEFIKKHTDIGADLLESTEGLKHLAPFVRHHHERWDGDGYPVGLTGGEIPLESRILGVCDAVETMASDRPYHRAMSIDAILAEVRRCAGTQFDPEVAATFIELVRARPGFIINSARSVAQQYAASILTDESLAQNMFAWVLQNGGPKELVEANGSNAADPRNIIFPRNRPSADPRLA